MDSGRRFRQCGKNSARGSAGLSGVALIDLVFVAGVVALMAVLLFPKASFSGRDGGAETVGAEGSAVRPQ